MKICSSLSSDHSVMFADWAAGLLQHTTSDPLTSERHVSSMVEVNIIGGQLTLFHAAVMLFREHRYRIPSLELTCFGTRSRGQKKSFPSRGTQYGRHVIVYNNNQHQRNHD